MRSAAERFIEPLGCCQRYRKSLAAYGQGAKSSEPVEPNGPADRAQLRCPRAGKGLAAAGCLQRFPHPLLKLIENLP